MCVCVCVFVCVCVCVRVYPERETGPNFICGVSSEVFGAINCKKIVVRKKNPQKPQQLATCDVKRGSSEDMVVEKINPSKDTKACNI